MSTEQAGDKVKEPRQRAAYRWMVFLLGLQAIVLNVSAITGVFTEQVWAASIWFFLIIFLVGAVFSSTEDSSRLRWTFVWLVVLNVSMEFWMLLAMSNVLLQHKALPFTGLFALQSSVVLLVGLWLLRQYMRRFAPPAEKEGEKK